jgi:hypothetical protein
MTTVPKLLLLLVYSLATPLAQAGLLYQIVLNGKGNISQKEIDNIGKQAYHKTMNTIKKCYGATYAYVAPGDSVSVGSRRLEVAEETLSEAQHGERKLTTIKVSRI